MQPLALTVVLTFGLNFFLLLVILVALNFLRKEIGMFIDDVKTALATQTASITALAGRLPAPVDPATIVPVADQQAALAGIAANTAAIDAIAPAPAPAPAPTPAP